MKKILSSIGLFLVPFLTHAHVGYVISEEERLARKGSDFSFFVDAITGAPNEAYIALAVVLALIGSFVGIRKIPWVKERLFHVRARLYTYYELLPWMARLSLGIALIGAGTAEVLVSPLLTTTGTIATIQILLGFFFLLGFLITPSILVTLGLYIYALSQDVYLLGNLDIFVLAVALFIFASGRPGLDDLLGMRRPRSAHIIRTYVPLILRLGLGTAFIFLGVYEKIVHPHGSELVVEMYNLTEVIPVSSGLWVLGAGLTEILLGILLIIGFEVRLVSMISFVIISLSFFYFKEDVYSHVTLFGALSMLFVLGAGKCSLDRYFKKREF